MGSIPDLKSRRSTVVEATAECQDCEWATEARKNALANASLHARRSGHTVQAEQVTVTIYNPTDSQPIDGSTDRQENYHAQARE